MPNTFKFNFPRSGSPSEEDGPYRCPKLTNDNGHSHAIKNGHNIPSDDALLGQSSNSTPSLDTENRIANKPLTTNEHIQQVLQVSGRRGTSTFYNDVLGARDSHTGLENYGANVSYSITSSPSSRRGPASSIASLTVYSLSQSDTTTAFQRLSSALAPVGAELLRLEETTPQSLPSYDLRTRANRYGQVLKRRLLPIGIFIESLVNQAPERERAGLEMDLCRYIAEEHWPLPRTPTSHLDIQRIYRNALFRQTSRAQLDAEEEAQVRWRETRLDGPRPRTGFRDEAARFVEHLYPNTSAASFTIYEDGGEPGDGVVAEYRASKEREQIEFDAAMAAALAAEDGAPQEWLSPTDKNLTQSWIEQHTGSHEATQEDEGPCNTLYNRGTIYR